MVDGFAIRQAYVTLRTPVGNGIDWKMGVFDSPLGYEGTSSINNPNFTRSYGYTVEPTELTGLIGSYKFCDAVSLSAGVVNTIDPVITERDQNGNKEDTKAYLVSLSLTAPQDWGWLAGSSLNAGFINGYSTSSLGNGNVSHFYTGATIATPVTGLKAGAAFDYRHDHDVAPGRGDIYVYGLYASYQATEKLGLNVRGEYIVNRDLGFFQSPQKGYELTFTAQYDLWKNVLSRAELRWDHAQKGSFGASGDQKNAVALIGSIAYKF